MKKICEIDGAESYARTGELPLLNSWKSRRYCVNSAWLELHFTDAQRRFLDQLTWTARPHPKHNPTIELFVDETDLTDRDWTVIRLLF